MSERRDPIDRLRDELDPTLIAAVSRLPTADREALLLVTWGELSYEQTAKTLGVSVETVRERIARAREGLRAADASATQDAFHARGGNGA